MEHEKVIHETIRHIRNEKKKRPDSKLIIRTATANSGLAEGTIRSSFDYLVENGSIYSKTSNGKESFLFMILTNLEYQMENLLGIAVNLIVKKWNLTN